MTNIPKQPGPPATSRALVIIHGTVFDGMAVSDENCKPLFRPNPLPNTNIVHKKSVVNAAIIKAAHQTLRTIYSKQRPIFQAVREEYLNQLKTTEEKQAVIDVGILIRQSILAFILANRQNDGVQLFPFVKFILIGYYSELHLILMLRISLQHFLLMYPVTQHKVLQCLKYFEYSTKQIV